jgi:NAD(P)-dependent dehydrogenase (short-subunit alcohol dehydrogenase family)
VRFAAEGAHVAICARTARDVAAVAGESASILAMPGDIADATFVDHLFAEAVVAFGRVDILVNNAAILLRRPFLDLDPADWDAVLNVNLRGAYLCCRAAFRLMSGAHASGGSIVNIASLSGVHGPEKFAGLAAYNVSKAGLLALSDALAVEGRPSGIRVNTVSPGAVDTAMLRQAGHGLRALATAEDVARTILFLAGDASRPMTGANVEILSNG